MSKVEPLFKGWAKPGPIPPGALTGEPALAPGETLDAISGHFRLFQLANGHRFSTEHCNQRGDSHKNLRADLVLVD